MRSRIRNFFKDPFNWWILFLLILNVLPIAAPILLHFGIEWLARPIYFIYSFTCHQFAHRSLHVYDHQCAWCSRDMAIWGAMLTVAILVKKFKIKSGLSWYWIVPFTIPIALDGGIQTIATMLSINPVIENGMPLYISTNFMRVVTGAIFGTGLGMILLPSIYNLSLPENLQDAMSAGQAELSRIRRYFTSLPVVSLVTISIVFIAFLGMILVWDITGTTTGPANALELQVKTPQNEEFFVRRETGTCPVNVLSDDPLALKCFFSVK